MKRGANAHRVGAQSRKRLETTGADWRGRVCSWIACAFVLSVRGLISGVLYLHFGASISYHFIVGWPRALVVGGYMRFFFSLSLFSSLPSSVWRHGPAPVVFGLSFYLFIFYLFCRFLLLTVLEALGRQADCNETKSLYLKKKTSLQTQQQQEEEKGPSRVFCRVRTRHSKKRREEKKRIIA